MIELKNVHKYFNRYKKNQIHVLNDISLLLPQKGLVVLLGKSGSGKTTLLNVMAGLDVIQKGHIFLFDEKMRNNTDKRWDEMRMKHIGYVTQRIYIHQKLTIYKMLYHTLRMMGIKDLHEVDLRINHVLKAVNLYPFKHKSISTLSSGQKQRASFAYALIKNSSVLLADEPTGNLDTKNSMNMMSMMKRISSTKLVVLVTHDEKMAHAFADRIIKISNGKIIEDYVVKESVDYAFEDEDTIYLKSLHHLISQKKDGVGLNVFSDKKEKLSIDINLVFKNASVYIDVTSDFRNIKHIDETSIINISNEYPKEGVQKDLTGNSFDTSLIDYRNLTQNHQLITALKCSLSFAYGKLKQIGIKDKIMIILLMICGFIMAFSINSFYTVNKLPYERYLEVSENYIELKHPQLDHVITSNETIYEDVRQWFHQIVQTQVYYLSSSNAYATAKFHIRGTSDEPFYRASIEYVGQFKDYDVIYGNYPEKTNEILVSSGLYQTNQFGSFNYNNIGIWSLKDFVGETIVVGHGQDIKEYHIVGIVDAMTKSIYVQSLYSLIEFTEGSPLSFSEDEDPYLEEQFIYHHLTTSSHSLRVYTENKYDMIQVFLDAGFNVTDLSHKAKSMHQSDVAHYYQTSFITSVMFILFGLATFYFIMHTSIKNRVDEIAFYRLLGIRRSILVFGSLIEIIVITTISSVVGYLLMTYISFEISRSPLNQSVYFNIDAQIISLGIISIYIINLVAGLFPVIQLLNKIPIKLLSSNST